MNLDLVSCTIEGNPDGSTAMDYTVNCAVGFPAITGGGPTERPVNHVLPAWDLACAYQAAFAIAAAVLRRAATGQGAELRLALSDVAFSTLSHLGMLAEDRLRRAWRVLGPYQTVREALIRDPRLSEANPVFTRIDTAGVGRHLVAGSTVRQMHRERGPTQPAPMLGQHTDEVLMDVLGLDSAAVGALHDRGVVAGAAT